MNTNLDETTLALWLDDELSGSELAAAEAWAGQHPAQIAARDEVRKWRAKMAAVLPATEEPPYPDFFNSRILRALREPSPVSEVVTQKPSAWRSWWMPLAACGGMALAFVVGKKSQPTLEYDLANAPRAIPVEPVVYTPENGVNAEWFASSKASATVIVLTGVAAIPDEMDFSATVANPMVREIDSTADIENQPHSETGP